MLKLLFQLPFLPVKGVVKLGEVLRDEAERQLYDPAAIRRQLEEAESSDDLTDEQAAQVEAEAAQRLNPVVRPKPDRR